MEIKSKGSALNPPGAAWSTESETYSEYMRFSGTPFFLISESELLKFRLHFPQNANR
jgi:hypothetical protein